jgi:hypothetical protein
MLSNAWRHAVSSLPTLFVPLSTHVDLQPTLARLKVAWLVPATGILLLATICLGVGSSVRRKLDTPHLYALLYTLMVLLTPWVRVRNWVPLLPLMYIWLLAGIRSIQQWLLRHTRLPSVVHKVWPTVLLALLLLSGLARDVGHFRRGAEFRRLGVPWPAEELALAKAAEWITANTNEDDLVLHIQPEHQFLYTGRQTTPTLASNDPVQISTLDPEAVVSDIYENFDYVLWFSYKDLIPGLAEEIARNSDALERVFDTGGDPHISIYRVHQPQ